MLEQSGGVRVRVSRATLFDIMQFVVQLPDNDKKMLKPLNHPLGYIGSALCNPFDA